MLKLLYAGAAFFVMSASANAADMPVKAVPHVPHCDWSGFYFGVSAGWGCANVDRVNDRTNPPPRLDYSTRGNDALFDFHGGVQGQWNHVVLGIEASISTARNALKGTHVITGAQSDPNQQIIPNVTGAHRTPSFYQLGARLGWAWDCWLLYASGGYVNAHVEALYVDTRTGGQIVARELGDLRFGGWYAGFGVENVLHKGSLVDVIAGFEYQHMQFGDLKQAFCDSPGCSPTSVIDFSVRAKSLDVARVRLSFKTKGWDIFSAKN